ncbi:MAG: 2Fe-2S iron-sulfur cluster-binding protein [Planctomycetota bacterium]
MTKIILNGKEVEADPAKPLVAACHAHGADVPVYCYHPGLTPVGSCRICQVEVKQGALPPRVVAACRTSVTEGMIVETESAAAHAVRRACLEFLLKDHPLDCPICDKAGECDLQDFAFAEGQSKGRTVEPRRPGAKRQSFGEVILYDRERCILCSRCVRFFTDVTGKPQLTVAGLAARSTIATWQDRPLEGNYQGNLADVCPVGALTLKKFRFQARVWNLAKTASTCGECSRGCAITVEVLRGGAVRRLRPRYDEQVNRWWMCDHGRFSFDRFDAPGRIAGVRIRGARGFEPASAAAGVERLADTLRVHSPAILVGSPWLTVEEGRLLAALAAALGAETGFVSPPPCPLKDDLLHTGDPCPNRRGLTELGLAGRPAAEWLPRLAAAEAAVLVGERCAELLGREGLAALPAALRLATLDTTVLDVPATVLALGVPNAAERTGTWINADGIRRTIGAARPAPAGTPPLTRTLEDLLQAVRRPAEVLAR